MTVNYGDYDKNIDVSSSLVEYNIYEDVSTETFVVSVKTKGENLIELFRINAEEITVKSILSTDTLINLLEIINYKEHTLPIEKIRDDLYTSESLIQLNRLLLYIYGDFCDSVKIWDFIIKYYSLEERVILFGNNKNFSDLQFSKSDLNKLQSSQAFGLYYGNSKEDNQLKFDEEKIYLSKKSYKCNLVPHGDQMLLFSIFEVEKDGMMTETKYGTYNLKTGNYVSIKPGVPRDVFLELLRYINENISGNNLIIYKDIFKEILRDNVYKDEEYVDYFYYVVFKDIIDNESYEKIVDSHEFDSNKVYNNQEEVNKKIIAPTLEKYGKNLNEISFKYDPAIGRSREIEETLVGLVQGSVVLVGEAGVGKTSIVDGIAYKLKNNDVPKYFKDKVIYSISAANIVNGCNLVGDLEKKMKAIVDEVIDNGNIILFMDEIHTVFGTGKGKDGSLDIANLLKPYVDRGQIKIIGATTTQEYYEYFPSDGAFSRRFDKIDVKEPDDDMLREIINTVINYQENEFGITIDEKMNRDNLIDSLIKLTEKRHRVQQNKQYNPAIVVSIIKDAFSYAVCHDKDILELEDVSKSIRKNVSDKICQPALEEFEREKNRIFIKNKVKEKIISFPSKY